MSSEKSTTRHGLAILGWTLLLAIGLSQWVRSQGLKWVQGVVWPTDLHTFSQLDPAPIDVAILGSSRASFAVSPSKLDTCLSAEMDRSTTSINLARTFATARSAQTIAEQLLSADQRPQVLVLAIGPEFFDESNPSRAAEIDAHIDLEDMPSELLSSSDLQTAWAALRPLGHGMERSALFLSQRHQQDAQLRWMMLHHGGGQFCFGSDECEQNNQSIKDILAARWDSVMTRMDALIEERFRDYQLGEGAVHSHLLQLIEWAKRHQVQLVLAETPLHDAWQSRIPPTVWQSYQAHLDWLEETHGLTRFQSTAPGWSRTRSRYIDPDHLSDTGSALYTSELCEAIAPLVRD